MGFFIKIYDSLGIFFHKYKILLNSLFRFLFIKVYFMIVIFLNIMLWLGAYYMYKNISQDIAVLHYNIDFGIDLIGHRNSFFMMPIFGLVFIIVNKIVLLFLTKRDDFKFLAHFLLTLLLLLNILLLLSLYALYLINF